MNNKFANNSPALDRFEDLLKRLRQSTINKPPTINLKKLNTQKNDQREREDNLENQFDHHQSPEDHHHQIQIHTQTQIQIDHPSSKLTRTPSTDHHLVKQQSRNQTSKSPLLPSPKNQKSFIVNLASSSSETSIGRRLTGFHSRSDSTLSPSDHQVNKLDWASLVEAAGKPDAEEEQLPDLTEWVKEETISILTSLSPSSLNQQTDFNQSLDTQSRPEIYSNSSTPVKVQFGPPSSALKHSSSSQSEQPSLATNPSALEAAIPITHKEAEPEPVIKLSNKNSLPTNCSSTRLLNSKQKRSIAKLIIPIPSPSSSTTTTANLTTSSASTSIIRSAYLSGNSEACLQRPLSSASDLLQLSNHPNIATLNQQSPQSSFQKTRSHHQTSSSSQPSSSHSTIQPQKKKRHKSKAISQAADKNDPHLRRSPAQGDDSKQESLERSARKGNDDDPAAKQWGKSTRLQTTTNNPIRQDDCPEAGWQMAQASRSLPAGMHRKKQKDHRSCNGVDEPKGQDDARASESSQSSHRPPRIVPMSRGGRSPAASVLAGGTATSGSIKLFATLTGGVLSNK